MRPNWQRMLSCAYTTQLLHSTVEVCWNNNDSYFIWFKFVCRKSGKYLSGGPESGPVWGLEYTSNSSRLAPLWEPNYGEHDFHFICGVDIVRIGTYIEQCVSLVFLFWGEVGKFCSSQVVPRERAHSPKSESRRGKLLRDGCTCVAHVKLGMRNVRRVYITDI